MPAQSFRLEEATIDDIHSAFRSIGLTCRRLVEMYLARVEAYDKHGPELNSIITINPNALEEAEELDRSFQRAGDLVGPLHGIPVLVKDQAETAGIRTTFGSIAFEDYAQADLPSIALPAGFAEAVPVGFELVVKPYGEADLLRLAYAYEKQANPRKTPETAPPLPDEPR